MIRLIIDTDPGVDDAHAIMAALTHPQAHVEAIMTVAGNVSLDRTTANACLILDILEQNIPVYAGCDRPLVGDAVDASYFHGPDGLGDSRYPPSRRQVEREHAVNALIRLANTYPGELTLAAIGPLTNVALATRLDPTLPDKIAHLVVMGGAIRGQGNVTPAAEFNAYADPEAAAIVFGTWSDLTLVSWETTLDHSISAAHVDVLLGLDSPRAEFFRRITTQSLKGREQRLGQRTLLAPDLLAIAVALEPDIASKTVVRQCGERAQSGPCAGAGYGAGFRDAAGCAWLDRAGARATRCRRDQLQALARSKPAPVARTCFTCVLL
jgi:purine nucleosidase